MTAFLCDRKGGKYRQVIFRDMGKELRKAYISCVHICRIRRRIGITHPDTGLYRMVLKGFFRDFIKHIAKCKTGALNQTV